MKSQVSVEFLILVSLLLVILVVVLIGGYSFSSLTNDLRIEREAKKLSDSIASEINLAIRIGDGYKREFFVDTSFAGITDFSIEVGNYSVFIKWYRGETSSSILVPRIEGEIKKGRNTLENRNGEIYVS